MRIAVNISIILASVTLVVFLCFAFAKSAPIEESTFTQGTTSSQTERPGWPYGEVDKIVEDRSVDPAQPIWNQTLRLIGVTSVDNQQTAHFSNAQGFPVLSLHVGETLPEGFELFRIENPNDRWSCRAIIRSPTGVITVGTLDYKLAVSDTGDEESQELSEASEERVTIRPWLGRKSW